MTERPVNVSATLTSFPSKIELAPAGSAGRRSLQRRYDTRRRTARRVTSTSRVRRAAYRQTHQGVAENTPSHACAMDSGVFSATVGTPSWHVESWPPPRRAGRNGTGSRIHSRAVTRSNPPLRGVFGCLLPVRIATWVRRRPLQPVASASRFAGRGGCPRSPRIPPANAHPG